MTHPRFRVQADRGHIEGLLRARDSQQRRFQRLPGYLRRWMLRSAMKESRLLRGLLQPESSYLDNLTTYVMKLGSGNLLSPFDSTVDRKFAASAQCELLRLRTQQTAELLAAAALREIVAAGDAPLHLINIAGGSASDSLNALLLLARSSPSCLQRPITIYVLDLDDAGPNFGRSALAELQAKGGPLRGLVIRWESIRYDWRDTGLLQGLVQSLANMGGPMLASSEGGLFCYGSDENLARNLKALSAGGRGVRSVVGTVVPPQEAQWRREWHTKFSLQPRSLEAVASLAETAGLRLGTWTSSGSSEQFELLPAPGMRSVVHGLQQRTGEGLKER